MLKTTQDMGQVFGRAFNDLNGNGIQDTYQGVRETAWPGATVYLDPNTAGTQQTTVKTNGEYAFEHVSPGTHNVQLVLPAGWSQTFPSSETYSVDIAAGSSVDGRDFGAFHPTAFTTYRNSVATKFPANRTQTALSTIKIADSYEIYDVAVNVTVSATPGNLYLVGPDGTKVAVTAGSTVHLTNFNYRTSRGLGPYRSGTARKRGPSPGGR